MGVSSDAILCYGISFPEGYEFPWDVESGDGGDSEYWWGRISGFVPTNPDHCYQELYDWMESHPIPFKVVRHGSDSYPMYILAVPASVHGALWGHPKELTGFALIVDDFEFLVFWEFIARYFPDDSGWLEPKWWLCSWLG